VTGVQTCALPISMARTKFSKRINTKMTDLINNHGLIYSIFFGIALFLFKLIP